MKLNSSLYYQWKDKIVHLSGTHYTIIPCTSLTRVKNDVKLHPDAQFTMQSWDMVGTSLNHIQYSVRLPTSYHLHDKGNSTHFQVDNKLQYIYQFWIIRLILVTNPIFFRPYNRIWKMCSETLEKFSMNERQFHTKLRSSTMFTTNPRTKHYT